MNQIARSVEFDIKKGQQSEFTRVYTSEVLPKLKEQKGFKQALAMLDGERAHGLSLWSDRPSVEMYSTAVYPKLLSRLAPFLTSSPRVTTWEIAASTFPA
jgi:hypothetical protein